MTTGQQRRNLGPTHMIEIVWIITFCAVQTSAQIPAPFDTLRLGMDWAAFLEARPNAKVLNMMPDSSVPVRPDANRPLEALTERFSDQNSRALFTFENARLVSITSASDGELRSRDRHDFLTGLANEYGMPSQLAFLDSQQRQAVLTWRVGDSHINAIVPVAETTVGTTSLVLQVMTAAYAKRIGALGTVKPEERDKNTDLALQPLTQEISSLIRRTSRQSIQPGSMQLAVPGVVPSPNPSATAQVMRESVSLGSLEGKWGVAAAIGCAGLLVAVLWLIIARR